MKVRVRDGLLPPSTAPFPTNRRPWYSGAECRLLIQAYTTVPSWSCSKVASRGVDHADCYVSSNTERVSS